MDRDVLAREDRVQLRLEAELGVEHRLLDQLEPLQQVDLEPADLGRREHAEGAGVPQRVDERGRIRR